MELRGLSECIFVRCIERKKGGFYTEIKIQNIISIVFILGRNLI